MKIKPGSTAGGVVMELGPTETRLPSRETDTGLEPLPVFQLKKILVPVDFSACSLKALRYAIPFAAQFNAHLVLLHVIEPSVFTTEWAPVEVQVEPVAEAQRRLEELQATTGDTIASTTIVRRGAPHIEIIETAKEPDIGLIILSTHGHTGLGHLFLGSVAEKVVRHAGCPVLIVREQEHEFVEDQKSERTGPDNEAKERRLQK